MAYQIQSWFEVLGTCQTNLVPWSQKTPSRQQGTYKNLCSITYWPLNKKNDENGS